jgi:PAS domain S-box-containing protein
MSASADPITASILANVVAIAADAIICIDDSQQITYFNEGAELIFGYSADEVIGRRIEDLIPDRFRNAHAVHVERFGKSDVKSRRMGERREIAGLRKGGIEFPAEAAISQLHHDGKTVYAVVLRDVTIRKKLETAQQFIAHAGETFASSFGSEETLDRAPRLAIGPLADVAVLYIREGETFRIAGTAHRDPARDTAIRALKNRIQPITSEADPLAQIVTHGQPVVIQGTTNRELVPVLSEPGSGAAGDLAIKPSASVFLPLIARGQLIGILALFKKAGLYDGDDLIFAEDLARLTALALDNARLHDEVRRGLKARDEMIGIVSHDLRNPVQAVKMLTGAALENRAARTDSDLENIRLVRRAAEQMDALIRDLLDATRLDSGRLRVTPEPVSTRALISTSLETLRPLATDKSQSLDLALDPNLPDVMADPERIQQALSNLVGNAIKFTPAGGSIEVGARISGTDVIVSVSDSGPGIPEDQLPNVFERFWQSRRVDRGGAGLGLPIAKGIIEAHGGRIWVESQPGNGATFYFTLPRA